jgi:excisionase family DNA binding protein
VDEVFADGALTVTAAAQFSGIGRSRLYELMTTGDLPFCQVGTRRLIPRRALAALLARHIAKPDPPVPFKRSPR